MMLDWRDTTVGLGGIEMMLDWRATIVGLGGIEMMLEYEMQVIDMMLELSYPCKIQIFSSGFTFT